jgi:hypothetical protein
MARMDEKPRHRFRFGLISLFALIAAVGILACFWNPFHKPSTANFGLIEVGMTVAEVEDLVGEPHTGTIDTAREWLFYGYQVNSGEEWFILFVNGQVAKKSRQIPVEHYPPA